MGGVLLTGVQPAFLVQQTEEGLYFTIANKTMTNAVSKPKSNF